MYRLTYRDGGLKPRTWKVQRVTAQIGRDPYAFIWINDSQLQPHHAIITKRDNRHVLSPGDEQAAVWVNDLPVPPGGETALRSGDRIRLGRHELVFEPVSPLEPAARVAAIVLLVALTAAVVRVVLKAGRDEPLPPSAPPPPAVTSAAPAAATAPPPEDPVVARLRGMLQQAREFEEAGRLDDADNQLAKLLMLAPSNVVALAERADLATKRGLPREAEKYWMQVLQFEENNPYFDRAAGELARMAESVLPGAKPDAPVTQTPDFPDAPAPLAVRPPPASLFEAPPVAPKTPVVSLPDAPPPLALGSIDIQRFPSNDRFEETRLLHIGLVPVKQNLAPDPMQVGVEVIFYDRLEQSGKIIRTRTMTTSPWYRLKEKSWTDGKARHVTAMYAVPAGFRGREWKKFGESGRFYGYRIRLYYAGHIIAEVKRPSDLAAD